MDSILWIWKPPKNLSQGAACSNMGFSKILPMTGRIHLRETRLEDFLLAKVKDNEGLALKAVAVNLEMTDLATWVAQSVERGAQCRPRTHEP